MPPREDAGVPRMDRIAVVAPRWSLRDVLVRVADAGVVEFDQITPPGDAPPGEAARRLQRLGVTAPPRLSVTGPDLETWERGGRADLLGGEAELAAHQDNAVIHDDVAALVGWAPSRVVPELSRRLAALGGAVATLPPPRGVDPPTADRPGPVRQAFRPLVSMYAAVPYRDIEPTVLAGLAYLVMFGAMFGDAGHGALLVAGALMIRAGRPARWRWVRALRPYWLFIAAAGVSAAIFGLLYGEMFGPAGLITPLWLAPMDQPVSLLIGGVALGAALLAGAYAVGTVNRLREGGLARALYAPSGIAGSTVFLAAGLAILAWYAGIAWLGIVAAVLAAAGLALAFAGLLAGAGGGGAGIAQAAIELFDLVIRLGANVLSFARLAAFGLTHAVLGWLVWSATVALWHQGPAWTPVAVVVFIIGNAVAFGIEALVAAIQALRLEYYELFSRVFEGEGRPFRPWRLPIEPAGPIGDAAGAGPAGATGAAGVAASTASAVPHDSARPAGPIAGGKPDGPAVTTPDAESGPAGRYALSKGDAQ